MDLKGKLQRLVPAMHADPRSSLSAEEAAAPHLATELDDPRARTLDELRAKMADILGRERPPPRAPADPALTDLPFLRIESEHGPLCQRLEQLRASHHVGRMPVDAARCAEAELLALLALDPGVAAARPHKALFVDVESTGLGAGAGTIAFLVGLAAFDAQGVLEVEQLLLRTPAEEAPMLRRLAERFEDADLVISFNGKAFDLPLLGARFAMNRLPPPVVRAHLDLLHIARRLHKTRIGACTLKAVEAEVLGFERDADIDGGEVAPRYLHFLRSGDDRALAAVVAHNYWDVISMAALVGLYGEPLGVLHESDLVGLATTLKRARALERALEVADVALARGAGPAALKLRGQIAKARGDRARALEDFEALSAEVDDATVRLELAKLYEHFVKAPQKALDIVEQGTGELEAAAERRRLRLMRKAAKTC